jgi:hypothetical protein
MKNEKMQFMEFGTCLYRKQDTIIVRGICGKNLRTINSIKKGSKLHEEWKDQISPQYATTLWNRITNYFLARKLISLQKIKKQKKNKKNKNDKKI